MAGDAIITSAKGLACLCLVLPALVVFIVVMVKAIAHPE